MTLNKLAGGLALALGLMASASAQTTMKISISIAQNSHQGVAIDTFAKEVEARTGGRYKIQAFYSGSLGGERESIEAVQLGTQELTFSSSVSRVNGTPSSISQSIAVREFSTIKRVVSALHRPAPATSVSSIWASTESASSSTAAIPPWAYPVLLSEGSALVRMVTLPASASVIAARKPASNPPSACSLR